jgi:tuftelin-interacting protein 11
MDEYDDYDDEDHVSGDDSDDEDAEMKFVSRKERLQYTTFGNEEQKQHHNDDLDGKEAALYGVFAPAPARRGHNITPSTTTTPTFVKGSSNELAGKGDEEEPASVEAFKSALKQDVIPPAAKDHSGKDKSIFNKEAEETSREHQEEANQQFLALLGRGRGQKRPRRTFERERDAGSGSGPTELQQQLSNEHDFLPASGSSENGGRDFQLEGGGGLSGGGGLGFKSTRPDGDAPHVDGSGSNLLSYFGEQTPILPPVRKDPNLGKWEKHTKGIGMKLLAKMGYQGSGGLGAKRKKSKTSGFEVAPKGGISRPVEVVVRPSNLGLGFGNFKEATKLKSNQQIEAEIRGKELPKEEDKKTGSIMGRQPMESSPLPTTEELLQQKSWKRGAKQASSHTQTIRKVVPYTDLLNKQKRPAIIDMRGPSVATDDIGEVPVAAELLHNASILLNTYENKLHSTSHFLQTSKQKLQSLQSDLDNMERRKKEGSERMLKLQVVRRAVEIVENLFKSVDSGFDMASKVKSTIDELREELTPEDRDALQFDQVLVPSLLSPLISSKLNPWEPLRDGSKMAEGIVASLLGLGSGIDEEEVVQERKLSMLSRQILPKVNAAYESTKWNPLYDFECGVSLYENLLMSLEKHEYRKRMSHTDGTVFPAGLIDNISLVDIVNRKLLKHTIFPKLMRVLSQWKAKLNMKGTHLEDPLELWLLPWMPHLDHPAILTQLKPALIRKVRSSLSCLSRGVEDDADFLGASIATLRPWRTLIPRESVHGLTSTYITPRLVNIFSRRAIAVDPGQQEWFTIERLMDLYDNGLMSQVEFISLLEGEILGVWAQKLHRHLLSNQEHDVNTLAQLYSIWKRKVGGPPSTPQNILVRMDGRLCRILYSCLKMIDAAVKGTPEAMDAIVPRASSYKEVLARRSKEERDIGDEQLDRLETKDAMEFRKRVLSRQIGGTTTFQEVVEDFAGEHDISFRPRTGGKDTTDEGKPIFLFGSVPIYLDSNVIFALRDARWQPVAMEHLTEIARNQ